MRLPRLATHLMSEVSGDMIQNYRCHPFGVLAIRYLFVARTGDVAGLRVQDKP